MSLQEFSEWFWWILAAVLALAEMLTPGVYLIWLALAATLVGVLGLVIEWGWEWQAAVFSCFAVVIVLVARKLPYGSGGGKAFRTDESRFLNRRNLSYIGREFVLQNAIEDGRGKIRIDDGFWLVSSVRDLPAGTRVRITGAEGSVLQVEEIGR